MCHLTSRWRKGNVGAEFIHTAGGFDSRKLQIDGHEGAPDIASIGDKRTRIPPAFVCNLVSSSTGRTARR